MTNLKKGSKVKNQYGETRTILAVIDGRMIRTFEEPNNLYHPSKLYLNGTCIDNI